MGEQLSHRDWAPVSRTHDRGCSTIGHPPRNLQKILSVVDEHGPLSAEDLSTRLRDANLSLRPQMLKGLPLRQPEHLVTLPDGRIGTVTKHGAAGGGRPALVIKGRRPLRTRSTHPVPVAQFLAVHLSRREDQGSFSWSTITPGSEQQVGAVEGSFAEVRAAVREVIIERGPTAIVALEDDGLIDAVLRPDGADAVQAPPPPVVEIPPVIDLVILAALVRPDLEEHSVEGLEATLGVESPEDRSTAERLADLLPTLIAQVDVDDPTWQLSLALLARAGSPLCLLLPQLQPPDLAAALRPWQDPLVTPAPGRRAFTTRAGVQTAAKALADADVRHLRPEQQRMADAIAEAFDRGQDLLVEAPTGTGKTLGYLLPAAVRSAKPRDATVIATHTKLLQRQAREEVQRLRNAGQFPAPFRQLFGVQNYLCTREIAAVCEDLLAARPEGGSDQDDDATARLAEAEAAAVAVRALATVTHGVWDDVTDQPLQRTSLAYAAARHRLTTDSQECEGSGCDWAEHCPFMQRREGMDRHRGVVATNHAVVANWALSPNGGGGLLGEREPAALVVDEAHRLEDSLTAAWTKDLSGASLAGLLSDLDRRNGRAAHATRLLREGGLDGDLRARLAPTARSARSVLHELGDSVDAYVHEYAGRRGSLELRFGVVGNRPEYGRVRDSALRMARLLEAIVAEVDEARARLKSPDADERQRVLLGRCWRVLDFLGRRCLEHIELLRSLESPGQTYRYVHLLHSRRSDDGASMRWRYERVPINVGPTFAERIRDRVHSLVLTSATLTVDRKFDFIVGRLGLDLPRVDGTAPRTREPLMLPSPFDIDAQAKVILTSHLPIPVPANETQFTEAAAADTIGFLSLSAGRTLALYAARSRMDRVVAGVRRREDELAARGVRLLVQGDQPPGQLVTRFRNDPGTALFGLRSYWEGFDAPGGTLSFLQIEKAPYPAPTDPIVSARSRAITDRGGNAFLEYVVPQTAIALAQGFGRLIRSHDDRGAALLLDRRLQYPSVANDMLLGTLPTRSPYLAVDRDDAWRTAIGFVDGVEPVIAQALDAPASEVETLLQRLRIRPDEPLEPQLREAARELFGIEDLLPEQVELMVAVLEERDAIGILPTGTGKSLTFQLPAVLHPAGRPTVVISPLVALIKDQVDDLRARRGLRVVAGITGRTSGAERTELLRDLAQGRLQLLYISPERLISDPQLGAALTAAELATVVVDEAHCISSWGHDFRPEFRQIPRSVRPFRPRSTLALTATAPPDVERDIADSLELRDPVVVRRAVTRPDLRYRVMEVGSGPQRLREILRLTEFDREAAGLVYVVRRAEAEEVAWLLRQAGVNARSYHAGMDPDHRESVQDDFLSGTTQVVVATKAFGMGVNKPDIAWVVHYNPPESLEAYVQEAGRAARSPELTGDCLVMYSRADVVRGRRRLERDDGDLAGTSKLWQHFLDAGTTTRADVVLDPADLAAQLGVEPDDLVVRLGWLERTGHLERLPDRITSGMIAAGRGDPDDPDERKLFRRVTLDQLQLRVGQRRRIDDLADLARALGEDHDRLAALLVSWTMQGLVTFQPSRQPVWRIRLLRSTVDEPGLERLLTRWRRTQLERHRRMAEYLMDDSGACRRVTVARVFGDAEVACRDIADAEPCDTCTAERPRWHALPLEHVPDPERLVNVDEVVLLAVRWADGLPTGRRRYGVAGLRMALLGKEVYPSGQPLGRGLLACPQFGALTHLRAGDRRLDESIDRLVGSGRLHRSTVTGVDGDRAYETLSLADLSVARPVEPVMVHAG